MQMPETTVTPADLTPSHTQLPRPVHCAICGASLRRGIVHLGQGVCEECWHELKTLADRRRR